MFRLTEMQKGMFLEWDANRDSLQYNICLACPLSPRVDLARLEASVRATVASHPVFRTRIFEREGTLVQDFDSTAEIPFLRESYPDEDAARRRLAHFARPFNLLGGELVRFLLIETPRRGFLAIDLSHLISDGSTGTLFFDEIVARYEGRCVVEEDATYAEFATAEEASFASAAYAEAAADLRARFAGVSMTLPEGDGGDVPAAEQSIIESVARIEKAKVDACCAKLGVTPNLFFMGTFARVIGACANERKVAFTTVNHGRRDAAFRRTYGACVKTVPVLGELKADLSLADYLASFKLHRAGVYPFTHAVRDLGLKPGFMFVFQEGTTFSALTLEGERHPIEFLSAGGASDLPTVQITVSETDGVSYYVCGFSCLPGSYTRAYLTRFANLFASVAQNFVRHSAAKLGEIPLVDESTEASLLTLSRGDDLTHDASATFVTLLAQRAAAAPEHTALVDCETSVSYGELVSRADALAGRLVACGATAGGFVGLMLPRRAAFPIAAIAAQKCGAGYVPIDPEYPNDRIAYMLSDSGAGVLVTTHALFDGKNLAYAGTVVFVEDEAGAASAAIDRSTPDTPAYMIYTSGSTGKPKGVVVPQRALCALCAWVPPVFGLTAESRVATHASFSFDASVTDLFPTLACGGELHVYSEEVRKDLPALRDYIVAHGITGGTMSTQIGMALLNAYPELPLSYLFVGGEKLLPTAKTKIRIINGYGPTEFTVCSSYENVDQSADGEIPIGRPVPNSSSFICDPLGQLVPQGMVGELCLAGEQMTEGYWQKPDKTSAAFVTLLGTRAYRTGDLARYNEKGLLEYRGRIDFQVKLRGFRIEIGEIEHAAGACAGVEAAIALVREIAGAQHLVLYYTGAAESECVRAKMAETLTSYMVPDFFVRMDALPMTPVGKVDRKALPLPALSDEPVEPPANERERQILDIAREVLKTTDFGVTHDFNRLGLTSLGAMTLIAQLRAKAGLTVTMRLLTEKPTVRQLAAAAGDGAAAPAERTAGRPKRSFYPMTENQRGVYADWLRAPDALQYNVPFGIRFPKMEAARLKAAAERVIDAHPAFKTRFVEKDGEIVQARHDETKIGVTVETLDSEPDAFFLTTRMRPFAPQEDLVRATVFATPSGACLFLDAHHSIFDGYSMGVFVAELVRVLEGGEPKGERATAFDAALDERDYCESELLNEDDAWFARYLDGCESTRVETSSVGAIGPSGAAARVAVRMEAGAVARRCGELAVSASDWFLTAFMELLRRVGRTDDVQITFVSAGRTNPNLSDTIGMFVRTVPVRNVKDASTFSETVRRTRNDVRDLIDRDRYSYARAAERLGLRPEIIFAFEGGLFDLPHGAALVAPSPDTAKCPLSVLVTPGKDDFELAFEYDASLYSEADMRALLGMFETLARQAVVTDDLRAIPLVPSEEAARLATLSFGGPITYDTAKTFVDVFGEMARTQPQATAVVDSETSLTYGELAARSDALAATLAAEGVVSGGFVGLMLPRRAGFVAAALAVQKCGAGYVPIDAEYPADRIAYMLSDSGAGVLVTTRALSGGKTLDFAGKVVYAEDLALPTETTRLNRATPDTPAYMIYTSGSTGRPKGVVVPHRALRHLCVWAAQAFELTPSARILTHASFSFDASVIDLFPTLASGAQLHVCPEEIRKDLPALRDTIVTHGITGCTMSTQIGMALIDTYPDLPLRHIMLGGEKLLPTAKTKIRIFNGYGPTEFCVCSSAQIVDQSAGGDIPIGRPAPGTSSFVVDRYGQLLPQGFTGELALAGPQLADGYWQKPDKTSAAFVTMQGTRAYRTGDLAVYNEKGLLEYRGRIDFQVKLRGFRIEIGEIEQAASVYPQVGAVAAEVREVGGAQHLVLYYAAEGAIDEDDLKAQMARSLTSYMVPDFFVRMDALPMTPNGKINRKALPTPNAATTDAFVEPKAGVEADIAAAYAETLKLDRFSATADFFLSGGTSLLGIKAVVALQKRGLDVQYGDLFKYKSPRALAMFLSGGESAVETTEKGGFDFGAYDYSKIDAALAATRTNLFEGFKVHSLGDVLLTGATGYLGIHILRYLLEHTSSSVVALVRPKRQTSAERRLDAQYVYYFGERLPRALRDRLTLVEGDVTDADLDAKLAGQSIQTVLNCAAMVKHYVADDAMDRVNVGGVENLVRWCAKTGARLVQTSTYSVGGTVGLASPAVLSERALFVGQSSDNDYVRTKFLAERLVLEAVAAGTIRGKVMRLGNLMGRESDGEFQMNVGANAFVNSLKSYKAIGAFPLEELSSRIEMSPIDRVAEAVCLLTTTPDDMTVFHPFNAYALDMGAVLGAMNRRGYGVDWVSRAEFAAHVEALRNDPARAKDLQGILHYAQRHLDEVKPTPVVNSWTTTVLYRLGFRWKPAADGYLANFFDMLDGLAVFG